MGSRLEALVASAGDAARAGRWQEADALWRQVLALDPGHAQALYSLGMEAYRKGGFRDALHLLESAHRASPREPMVLLSMAFAHRELGDVAGERAAITAALALDPYFLPGLLAKADHLYRQGARRTAAAAYRNALQAAPPEPHWPAVLRAQLEEAKGRVEQHQAEFLEYLHAALGGQRIALDASVRGRWDEALSIFTGRTRPYESRGNQLTVPRLPAIPFYDRAQFPWVEELEASTDAIRGELEQLLAREADFRPYVAYKPGEPVNQWRELNHSTRWSSYKLWSLGEPVSSNLAACPKTAAALEKVGMATIDQLCPNAMFSALAPHTHIPPHHGETNARLVVHLPLIVPEHCRYRVGYEQREWKVGEALIFDDSIEHEARNDSDQLRVVLIFDVWNPLLSQAERDLMNAMNAAARDFRAEEAAT